MILVDEIQYKNILVELLADKQTFADMVDALDNVFRDYIDYPVDQLNRLRLVRQSDDIDIRRETLRMLGFDVTRDFITLNDNISNVPFMFSHYYENAHSDDFWRFISFVLGRNVVITPLYTNDYKVFYEHAFGTENVDGGDWYKTTHIDVSVDVDNLNGKLVASPGKSFQDRILDLFFEFAPIQIVVRNFMFSLTTKTKISFIGALLADKKYISIGGEGIYGGQGAIQLQDITIDGATSLLEGESRKYRLILHWTSDYTEVVDFADFKSDDFRTLTIDKTGVATAQPLYASKVVRISANYGSYSTFIDVNVIASRSLINETSINIEGSDTVTENSNYVYQVRIVWSDGRETLTSTGSNLEWSSLSPLLDFSDPTNGNLTVNSTSRDAKATMYLQYTTQLGTILKVSKTVTVLNVDSSVFLAYILINGPTLIQEAQTYNYTCTAYYSDGSSYEVTPIWYLRSTAGEISTDGILKTFKNEKTITIKLRAEFEYRGVKQISYQDIVVLHLDEFITDASIVGPDIIFHKQRTQYHLAVLWSNNVRTYVRADEWETNRFYIDELGVLNVGAVDESLWIEIRAKFFYKGAEYNYYKYVRAVSKKVEIEFVSIKGASAMNVDETRQMQVYAHNSDGSRFVITDLEHLTWTTDVDFAEIDNTGALKIISTVTSNVFSVNVEYIEVRDSYSVVHNATHYIAPIVPIVTVEKVTIYGPNTLMELSREQYTAEALYSDGSIASINPDWILEVLDTQYEASDLAHIDRNGFLNVRQLETPARIVLRARFYGVSDSKNITLDKFEFPKKLPPFSATIVGPDIIDTELGYGQYTLYVRDDEFSSPYALSADWSMTADKSIATMDDYGNLRVYRYEHINTVVTARYSCTYLEPIVVEKNVIIPGRTSAGIVTIEGPNVIFDQSSTNYHAYVKRATDNDPIEVTTTTDTKWTLLNVQDTYTSSILVNPVGVVTVDDLKATTTFTLMVEYVEGADTYSGNLDIKVLVEAPTFGVGPFGIDSQDEAAVWVSQMLTSKNSGALFTITVPADYYGYFMHPAEYGIATFIETLSEQEGGWDGASWPQNEIGTDFGPIPIDIILNGMTRQYYLYRTDFSGLGVVQFRVSYSNK